MTTEALTDDDLERWQQRITACRRAREQMTPLWARYARLHTNVYLAMREKNDDQGVHLPNGDQIKVGLVHRNVEQTLALLETADVSVRATAQDYLRELGGEDTHRENVVEAATLKSMENSGLLRGPEEIDFIKRDGVIIGHGVNYTYYRVLEEDIELETVAVFDAQPDGSFAPALDNQGQPVYDTEKATHIVYEAVADEHVPVTEFLFDWDAPSIKKSAWHGREQIVALAALKTDPRYDVPADIQPGAFKRTDLYGEEDDDPLTDSVRLLTLWDKQSRRLLTFIEGAHQTPKRGKAGKRPATQLIPIGNERFPVQFTHPDDSPFTAFVPIPANDLPCGISQIEHIRNTNNEADKIRTRLANLTRQLKRIMWYRKGRIDASELQKALEAPDTTPVGLQIQDGEKREEIFGELPIPNVHPELFAQRADAEEDIRKTTGISEVPFGGTETATESENVMAIGSARPNRKRRLFLSFLSEIAQRHLDFLKTFAPSGQTVVGMGPDGRRLTFTYGREALQGTFRLQVSPGGEAARVSPAQQKLIADFYPQLMGRFGPVFDRIALRQVLTMLNFRDVEALTAAADMQLAQLMPGQGTAPGGPGNPNPAAALANAQNGQVLRQAINAPNE